MNTVCKQLQNWKKKKNVFAVSVFLQITNALACHLLQCSAHATCYPFLCFLRRGRGKKKKKKKGPRITCLWNMRVGGQMPVTPQSLQFCFFFFHLTAAALSHAYTQNQLPIPSVKHSQQSAAAKLLLKAVERRQPFELSHQKDKSPALKCFSPSLFLTSYICVW